MNTKPITVIYHSADFDGEFCHQIARKFLGDEAEYIGWNFGDRTCPASLLEGRTVYVLDLPIDQVFGFDFTKIATVPPRFCAGSTLPDIIWIDHHKSSIESHPKEIPGYRIDGVAACRLAWQWFSEMSSRRSEQFLPRIADFGVPIKDERGQVIGRHDYKVSEPQAVKLAGQYDIWDKQTPEVDLFQHGLRSQDLHAEVWEDMLSADQEDSAWVEILLGQAEVLDFARRRENASIIKDIGFTFKWEGLTFLACNHARYNSLLFTAGLTEAHDACFGFKWTGKDWSISLYHAPGKEQHDLSLIAVKHGGGGHRGACGFRTKTLPFLI